MTAQATFPVAPPSRSSRSTRRRSALATWAMVLTLLAALVGAGVCVTATQAEVLAVQAHVQAL